MTRKEKNDTSALAQRIKRIRKTAKLTQKEFGAAIGVQRLVVTSWEQGQKQPGKARLYVIADRFKVNVEWLQTGEGNVYQYENPVAPEAKEAIERECIRALFANTPRRLRVLAIDVLLAMNEDEP